ncbi:MAG TPA: radical SAM family heme chaperone HemW [Candidatus Acidoferrales bacterium]|nr:radical SAM family heme chaperone HemW [Candidatus Acidoferrales bacterium]
MSVGVYIQVPFCQTKCTYCNFHTGVVSRDRYEPYADAVCREITESVSVAAPSVDTVYVGGGTPSLLDPAALARILDTLRRTYSAEFSEITLEADPETITPHKAAAWFSSGFNRISLGAQSFEDRELQAAGRMHRREDIWRAVDILRAVGFRNISLDLIAGLPHQTRDSWEASVSQLLRVFPEHVSIYMLEIDEGSRLGRESLEGGSRYSADAIPSDDAMAEFYESASARLADAGYEHYEISNWGLSGRASQHNLKYWRREPYLGFGAGAHSFDGVMRWANVHEQARYVALIERGASAREQMETVLPLQAFHEEFFLGLRQLEGIDFERIARDYEPHLSNLILTVRERIASLRSSGFMQIEGERLRIAPDRLTVSNEVLVQLLG